MRITTTFDVADDQSQHRCGSNSGILVSFITFLLNQILKPYASKKGPESLNDGRHIRLTD